MNVEIGVEAAIFPEKEYIRGIFVALGKRGGGLEDLILTTAKSVFFFNIVLSLYPLCWCSNIRPSLAWSCFL
jgi:hypothetical protein